MVMALSAAQSKKRLRVVEMLKFKNAGLSKTESRNNSKLGVWDSGCQKRRWPGGNDCNLPRCYVATVKFA